MEKKTRYVITTKTSDQYKHGKTDAEVFIRLIGKEGRGATKWLQLDHFFRREFELGRVDRFTITAKDVGLPEVICLKINKARDRFGWYCDTVCVADEASQKEFFFVYTVVLHEVAVRRGGGASLPQKEISPLHRDIRRMERDNLKFTYQWHLLPRNGDLGRGLPRYCTADTYEELPLMFQADDLRFNSFMSHRKMTLVNCLLEHGKSFFVENSFKSFDDFINVFNHPSVPSDMPGFHHNWDADEEFGRQILNGVNPIAVQLCKDLPKQLEHAEGQIFDELSCAEECKAKRVYCVNYRGALDGLRRNKTKGGVQLHCADPICLLYVGDDMTLRPIAIQLEEGGHVFTPKDSEHDWLLAKLYFRNTDTNIHEFKFHLLKTHIVMEPIAIGLFRSLPQSHPIYKLLRPHLQTVPSINTLGRSLLIGPNAAVSYTLSMNGIDMVRATYKQFKFEDLIIPKVFKDQGTDDVDALPFYHYRDDALLLWNAIEKYAADVIRFYYVEDKDVVDDFELTEFVRTVVEDGVGWTGDGTKRFPTHLTTITELVEYATVVIFTCSVQHAATNFGQFESYKFIPNSPGGMRKPPHKKGEGSLQRIFDSLPDPIMSCLQVGISFTLSSFAPNEIYLGDFPVQLFTELQIKKFQEQFRCDLQEISDKIKERNKSLLIPYTFLLPERIPISIAA